MATYNWNPWTVSADRRILADEAEWQKPHDWNREAMFSSKTWVNPIVIVRPDVFEDWDGNIVHNVYGDELWTSNGIHADYCDERFRGKNPFPLDIRDLVHDIFATIDTYPNLDWLITTSEPGRVREMIPVYEWHACHTGDCPHWNASDCNTLDEQKHRDNVILSAGPIRTQSDADRLVGDTLELYDLCGGVWVTAAPAEQINPWWFDLPDRIVKPGSLPIEYMPVPRISGLHLTGGIPEHGDNLAAQCESAGVKVLDLREEN